MTADAPARPRVLLGVGGGIAAYKVCSLLRLLTEGGHDVRVLPTEAALHFVGSATWEALSGHPVTTTVWQDVPEVPHVRLGRDADLLVVAPATADLLARIAHGRADDLLTATLLTARCPVLLAPAMHTEMWTHPATVENVATLRRRGVVVLDPDSGRLTGADTGPGRMPEPGVLHEAALALLRGRRRAVPADLAGRRVLVSAGGTREPLDPVRYLGNRSSGRQGFALAATAAARGATVELVAANTALPVPAGVHLVPVSTAAELADAVLGRAADQDVVVMAAAVADFRPDAAAAAKIKKRDGAPDPVLHLVRTRDVLATLVEERAARGGRELLVGFAAETGDEHGDVLHHARAKLARKGCDLLVVNDVSGDRVFGRSTNAVTLLSPQGDPRTVPEADKAVVADAVWDRVAELLAGPGR